MAEKTTTIELAQAVLRGAKHHVLKHHWADGMYQDVDVCVYCDWAEGGGIYGQKHAADCPVHKAKEVIANAL